MKYLHDVKGGGFINILELLNEHYDSFSKSHKKLADYISANFIETAFMNITELSSNSKISTATITRFVKILGFDSFNNFQAALKMAAKKEIVPVREFKFFVKEESQKNVFYDQVSESVSALNALYNDELCAKIENASEALCKARNIYILASRSSFAMAYYCYFSLKRFQENVFLIENRNDDISINLQYIQEDDVLLAIGYPLYTNLTLKIIKYFKSKNCQVVCITDSHNSPLAKYATHLLVVKNRLKIYFITTITVINTLIVMIGKHNQQLKIAGFEEENEVTRELGIYFKGRM